MRLTLRRPLRNLPRDRRGVAAVEFALVTPMMILMFFGMVELGQGLIAARRVTHACSALGDLVAQDDVLHDSEMSDAFSAASDILTPLPTSTLQLRVTSVTRDSKGNNNVDWSNVSASSTWSTYPQNQPLPASVVVPTGLLVNSGDTIILSEASYNYTSPIGYVLPTGMAFQRAAYLRPRQGSVQRATP